MANIFSLSCLKKNWYILSIEIWKTMSWKYKWIKILVRFDIHPRWAGVQKSQKGKWSWRVCLDGARSIIFVHSKNLGRSTICLTFIWLENRGMWTRANSKSSEDSWYQVQPLPTSRTSSPRLLSGSTRCEHLVKICRVHASSCFF